MDNCLNNDLITISDLTFSHGDRLLYDGINLTIPRGKVTAVMGPSGIGKTTLLRLIGGQLKPESGHTFCLTGKISPPSPVRASMKCASG